eukprot:g2206.t1
MHHLSTGEITGENIFACSLKNFSIGDINRRKGSVLREINGAADRGDPICMHAFLKLQPPYPRKYIYLRKWFVLHWRNQTTGNIEHCSNKIPQSIHEEVYFDQNVAEKSLLGILEGMGGNDVNDNTSNSNTNYVSKSATNVLETQKLNQTYAKNIYRDIALCWKSGNIVETYQALISYALLDFNNRMYLLFDIIKMLRSPAQIFNSLKYENLVLQNLISGYNDHERISKHKITLNDIRKQIIDYKKLIEQKIISVGKVFLTGINYEVNGKFKKLEKIMLGQSLDKFKRYEALKLLQQLSAYMQCVSACVAASIHSNYPYIHDIVKDCVHQNEIYLRNKAIQVKNPEKGLGL